jgi:DNA-binding response OmpR family regulator
MNCSEARRSDAPVRSVVELAGSQRGTVLIVTSDEDFSGVAARVLREEGYDVVTAPHPGHAILAALTRARLDVLITELQLDDMPGHRLAATLRRYHPQLRSLFMAQASSPRLDGVLVRPFTRDELLIELNPAPATASPAS